MPKNGDPLGFLFSAHISYGKGKYLNQTGFFFFFFFFLQNLPRFYLYLNLRVLPIEFNPHKFSFVRYVFVEIFEVFLKNDENDENVVVEQFGAENIPLLSGRLVKHFRRKTKTSRKLKWDPLQKKHFREKSHNAKSNWKGGTFGFC